MTRQRFEGRIAGVGSTSGVRVVVGRWERGPLGAFADAMVATPEGRRILLAPSQEVADFVAATYSFDEVRIEPFDVTGDATWQVRSPSLTLALAVGRRTVLGRLLRLRDPARRAGAGQPRARIRVLLHAAAALCHEPRDDRRAPGVAVAAGRSRRGGLRPAPA